MYSVTPKNLFFKIVFFEIGPLISLDENPDLIIFNAISNDFFINHLIYL